MKRITSGTNITTTSGRRNHRRRTTAAALADARSTSTRTTGTRTTTGVLAAVSGLGLTMMLLWQASGAAFTGTTDNGANIFSSATVALEDDDTGALLFDTTSVPMVPGDSYTRCIEVEYTGTSFDVTPVKLYSALATNVDNFADHLDVTVDVGTGGSFGTCTGFSGSNLFTGTLASLASAHSDYSNGLTGWTPSSGQTVRVFRFNVVLGSDTPNSAQGDSATATFTWEIQSA